ncbi:14120_t:CDS:2 [Ambispora leptoticha]|uniref:14120_t:CDS:1 n=1 Tax=Ambispora leptoticha TaxID=144679 RepID=A0A9N8ZFU6_9GLOM|nr:14120_t:CDS:2 [Ambispora leptoticha]
MRLVAKKAVEKTDEASSFESQIIPMDIDLPMQSIAFQPNEFNSCCWNELNLNFNLMHSNSNEQN